MTKSPHTGGERGIVPDWRALGITRRLEVHDHFWILPQKSNFATEPQEVPLTTKVFQVRQQLDAGTVVLVYDEATESCTIQPTHQLSDHP